MLRVQAHNDDIGVTKGCQWSQEETLFLSCLEELLDPFLLLWAKLCKIFLFMEQNILMLNSACMYVVFRYTCNCREANIFSTLCPVYSDAIWCERLLLVLFSFSWISRSPCGQVSVTFSLIKTTKWVLSTEGKSAAEVNCLACISMFLQEKTYLYVKRKDCVSCKWTSVKAFDTLSHEPFLLTLVHISLYKEIITWTTNQWKAKCGKISSAGMKRFKVCFPFSALLTDQ